MSNSGGGKSNKNSNRSNNATNMEYYYSCFTFYAPLHQREYLTAKIPTPNSSASSSAARSNSHNQQQNIASAVTSKPAYETARICLPNNTTQDINLPVVPRENLEFKSLQRQPQPNLIGLNSEQVNQRLNNDYISQYSNSQYPSSSFSYYSTAIYPDSFQQLVPTSVHFNNNNSEQFQNQSPKMNQVTGPIRRTPIIKQQSLAAAPYPTNSAQKQRTHEVTSSHVPQSIKPIANEPIANGSISQETQGSYQVSSAQNNTQITDNANTNIQQQLNYAEDLSISDQTQSMIIQANGSIEHFLIDPDSYESYAKTFSNVQNDKCINESINISTNNNNLILEDNDEIPTNDINSQDTFYSIFGKDLDWQNILPEDGFDPIPDLSDNSNVVESKKDIEPINENLIDELSNSETNDNTNEFAENIIVQLSHNLSSTSQLSDSDQSRNEGNDNSQILVADDTETGNGESSRTFNNDTIPQFLPNNREAWEIASDNSGEQSQTHQESNDSESFNRFAFFRAMRTRLDTLAKFIKGSFSNERNEGVGLWERIFPLIKQECTHIQRLVDATEWKSLDFPKSRTQFPLEVVDRELMEKSYVPKHAGEFQCPLQIIKDGNDGFRAISILLNATEIGINRDNFYEELRVRTALTMINKQDSTRRLFDSHLDEVSMKGGNIKLSQIAREYYHAETLEFMELLRVPSKSPDYDIIPWQIEALRTCMDGHQIGVPQLLTMANMLKATIRIMHPNYSNTNFRVPIKCKGNSKRIFVITMLDSELKAEEELLDYFIAPLIRKIDIFEVIKNPDRFSDRQEQMQSPQSSLTNILSQQHNSLKLPQNHHQHNYQLQSQQPPRQPQYQLSQPQNEDSSIFNNVIVTTGANERTDKGKGRAY
ncbi:9238_t:CDS:2 [Ambispora leptoticha]|uniref:9238_t:CDS:1 n=1 Tax=Ambispora leptoticha TaxID=144679 RepID=A0A9N8ZT88_9GLOM|nr:9238_t:CDS:2 [Ambispora leptoticha]